MSQSFVVHPRKDVGGEIERQRGGIQSLLQIERRGIVSPLLLKINLELHLRHQNKFDLKCKLLSNIIMRHALREVGSGVQVQHMKPFFSCKNVLARLFHNHFNFINSLHNLRIWIPLKTSRHFSDDAWTNSWHLQEVYNNCGSICIKCIPISMNKIAWHFMRARHKELMLCWRVGNIGPIYRDFVGNLNKTEYLYIVSHLALQHTYYQHSVKFLHTCAQVCVGSYPIFQSEKNL